MKSLCLFGQGLFFVEKYTPDEYHNHRQNWALVQDDNQYMFFGNQVGGVVYYDGVRWESKHLPYSNTVRSLILFNDSIFWGGVGDYGRITKDSLNKFIPHSLVYDMLSKQANFSDVWQMLTSKDILYLRTHKGILVFKDDEETHKLNTEYPMSGLFKMNGIPIVQLEGLGLSELKRNKFKFIDGSEVYANDRLYVVLPFKDKYLFISRNQGFVLYDGTNFTPFRTEVSEYVKEHKIYRGIYINNSEIALATLTGGIVIINTQGTLQTILTETEGLPTNIIYELYLDREETLWVATDNGLAKILINNPVTKIDDLSGFSGIPSFIESIGSTTYFGSTEGLFYSSNSGNINKIPGFEYRVYDGAQNKTELLVTTDEGIFTLQDYKASKLSSSAYRIIKASATSQNLFYGVIGQQVVELRKPSNTIQETTLISLDKLIYDLYADQQHLWVITDNEGIFRYSLDGVKQKHYTINIAKDNQYQQLEYLQNRLQLGTDTGLYFYSTKLDSFVVDSAFNDSEMISNQVNGFEQCADDEIWFRNNRKIKRAVLREGAWKVIEDPYRLIDEGETITTIECGKNGSMWFGGTAGIYHLSDPDWEYTHEFNTNITGLLVHNDSLIYGGYGEREEKLNLPYAENELRFTYAAASYIAPEENMYRVRLKGYNDRWSNWTSETEKDYTFVPEGTYTFEVQGRNVYHKTGSIDTFTFTVLPPWYRTIWAYLLYLLIIGSIIYGIYRYRINNILREQRVRNRIASDLHDEVSATLSSISFFAQAIRQSSDNNKGKRRRSQRKNYRYYLVYRSRK